MGVNLASRAAYVAGLIDADGHIAWRGGRNNSPLLGVTNTSLALMDWLKANIGGSVSMQRGTCPPACPDRPKHFHRKSDIYRWQITGQRAFVLAQAIRPFLIIKGDRADDVCAKFRAHVTEMQRPARRLHHVARESVAMAARGWD